jgi:C1A family cysteine protease
MDQGQYGSCTAHGGIALVAYNEIKTFGKYAAGSRMFLYYVTRWLEGQKGDTGAEIRDVLKALVEFGVPEEKYWPYDPAHLMDTEPNSACFAQARNYATLTYFRHDPSGVSPANALASLKSYLAAGIPAEFGFTVYSSFPMNAGVSNIPMPGAHDSVEGGHAVMAVDYDDTRNGGSILFQNSWGPSWGDQGFGWLPYGYFLKGLASDIWSITKEAWLDPTIFA